MLRGVLLALLSLSAVSCKSHDESQAKSQPGVAAGKVLEVTGTVTLHHGTETRPLAKGDMVDADDIVETGADGSAVIEVQHNNVSWELGANKKGKLRDALAWTQPKKEKTAQAGEEDSAAAGRHAERSAADNSATANERARDDVEGAKADRADSAEKLEKKKGAPPPKPEPAMAPRAESAAAPAPVTAPTAAPPVAQPQPPGAAKEAVMAPSATAVAPPPPPSPPPKTVAKSRSMAPSATVAPNTSIDSDLGLSRPDEGGGGSIGAPGGGGGGGGSSPDAAHLVLGKKADLRACVKSVKSLRIKIEVDAAGKATVIFVDKANAADQDCVKKVIDGIKFPAAKTTFTTTLTA